ncbi:PTS transporter subunit EIIC [Lapidilactobacillus luobeiensis]|uniref:PTS transporter subunit EIIC n=1 Tax=Lapidilactobacillus luobeiensis TaxID=2950371 RepID=UPI0021C4B42B|nr:PTS transporter subunit EIIC [Lapidilactobacillus luobeiensis]
MTKVRSLSFFQIMQRTLVILFPFALFGAFAQVFAASFLSVGGFFGSIFNVDAWLPHYEALRVLFEDLSQLTLGMLTVAGAFQAAKYTAKYYHKDDQMAGLTGAIGYSLIFFHHTTTENGIAVEMRYYDYHWLLVGVLVGYGVGRLFRRFGQSEDATAADPDLILNRAFLAMRPILITLFWALILHTGFAFLRYAKIDQYITMGVQNLANQKASLPVTFGAAWLTTILGWFGFTGPLAYTSKISEIEIWDNLDMALSKGNSWQAPHPYTALSLYHSFGTFGGTGALLALLIGLILLSRSRNSRLVAQWSFFPAIFNAGLPIMLGIPILLNPLFFLPFTLIPLINMGLAAGAIALRWMPPVVYPVPAGTPGPLVAFIGTNGNFAALIFGISLLVIDVLLYWPFIRLTENVNQHLRKEAV